MSVKQRSAHRWRPEVGDVVSLGVCTRGCRLEGPQVVTGLRQDARLRLLATLVSGDGSSSEEVVGIVMPSGTWAYHTNVRRLS